MMSGCYSTFRMTAAPESQLEIATACSVAESTVVMCCGREVACHVRLHSRRTLAETALQMYNIQIEVFARINIVVIDGPLASE